MEADPTPLYAAYSNEQLRVKIATLQGRIALLEGQIDDARSYQDEMIGLLALRGDGV